MKKEPVEIFRENYLGNEDSLQKSLFELKKTGCTQLESVKILMEELHISLREADEIILNAKAWEQEKTANLHLREDFGKAVFQLVRQEAFDYTAKELSEKGIKHEVHKFPSGAIMVDIWLGDIFYVVQFEEEFIGLSKVTEDTLVFDTIPDEKYYNAEEYKKKLGILLNSHDSR